MAMQQLTARGDITFWHERAAETRETNMASSGDSNVKEHNHVSYKKAINTKIDLILQNRKHANDVFDVIEYLQVCDFYLIFCLRGIQHIWEVIWINATCYINILFLLQSEKEKEILFASNACSKLFCELMERGDMYVGELPKEEDLAQGK